MARGKKKGPFQKTLRRKLTEMVETKGLKNLHVSWGPEGLAGTDEDRARWFLEFQAACDAQDAKPERQKMLEAMMQAYEKLHQITKMCQINVREWVDDPEGVEKAFAKKRTEIFAIAESASWPLGNFVRNVK